MEPRARKLSVFKIEPTPFSPSIYDACPWMWTCNMPSEHWPIVVEHSGGCADSWEVAHLAAVTHALASHGVRI